MAKTLLELRHITKRFDENLVLDDVSLSVGENEFLTLLGPSGCGKSTILRIVGGFETPDEGSVFFEGKDQKGIPPNQRPLNTVFQKYALFPHMTVGENVAFGLRIAGKPEDVIRERVHSVLERVHLAGYENRKPESLSGGQQQRVAVARAIVNEPKMLLLDEPLAALDLKLREELHYELKSLQNDLGITFLYVTHDQEEALVMSDKIAVLNGGKVQQFGTPVQIYNEPINAFVASFIGDSNIIPGTMVRDRLVRMQEVEFPCIDEGFGEEKPVDVVVRPEDLIIRAPGEGKMDGEVISNVFIGVHYEMQVRACGFDWLVQDTTSYPVGMQVSLDVLPENIQVMHKPRAKEEEILEALQM